MSQPKLIDVSSSIYIPAVTLVDALGAASAISSAAPSVGTQTSVASSASDATILAANVARKGAIIYNDSTAILYILLAVGTSSTSNYSMQIPANGGSFTLNPGEYTGVIKGLWASANGNARVTEFS